MRKIIAIIFQICFLLSSAHAQNDRLEKAGLSKFTIKNDSLGEINFYVSKDGIDKPKPILIYQDGSGHYSLVFTLIDATGKRQTSTLYPFSIKKLSEKYHVVLISKPGVPFYDSARVKSFDDFKDAFPQPKYYLKKLSLNWRVYSASAVIDYLYKRLPHTKEVVVMGFSEGGQVVPKLAYVNKKVTKLISVVGSGLNQFFDNTIHLRMQSYKGEVGYEAAQQELEGLYKTFEDIYANPKDTERQWSGHTYQRWASFCEVDPSYYLERLKIPILLVACARDNNSPILGIDYVKINFLRLKKNNLEYKVYPLSDHYFNVFNEQGAVVNNVYDDMMDSCFAWAQKK